MPTSVLTILKFCLLAVLYLFLFRVIRAVWVELRADQPETVPDRPTDRPSGRSASRSAGAESRAESDARTGRAARGTGPTGSAAKASGSTAKAPAKSSATSAKTAAGTTTRRSRKQVVDETELKIVEPPERRGTLYPLTGEVTIGRAPGCAIRVDDTFASQLHARVFFRDGRWYVEDIGSTNGTWLNRKRVHGPVPIAKGDRIAIGDTVLELRR
jgi:hypothetical protein